MLAYDFEYDGEYLKDWGYIICNNDSSGGFETINSDSQLTFDTVSQFQGKLFELTTSHYDDHIELTFQICKFSCEEGITSISVYESRELKRWLNRPEFHRFKLIQPDWADIYMEGSFNINNIELNGRFAGTGIGDGVALIDKTSYTFPNDGYLVAKASVVSVLYLTKLVFLYGTKFRIERH